MQNMLQDKLNITLTGVSLALTHNHNLQYVPYFAIFSKTTAGNTKLYKLHEYCKL